MAIETAKLDGATIITIPEGVRAYLVAEKTNVFGIKSEEIKPFETADKSAIERIAEIFKKKKEEVV